MGRPLADVIGEGLGRWAEEYVLLEARAVAGAMGMPDAFVRGIKLRQKGPLHWQLYNDWWGANYHTGAMNVPLARFWESGTRRHFVAPVYKRALSWTVTFGGSTPHPQFMTVRGSRTIRFFSKGHYVSGIGGDEPMKRAFEGGMRELRARIEREVETWKKIQEWGI